MAKENQYPQQLYFYQVEKQVQYDGIEMGVLENGLPYLSESGLARMCGIDRKVLNRMAENWQEEKNRPRGCKINELLLKSGYTEEKLFIESQFNNVKVNVYTEPVCIALLEYYAFISDPPREEAINAFRALARKSFRDFIYAATQYSPEQHQIDSWRQYHDRVNMTTMAVPDGYFGTFHEIAVMIVPMIQSGVIISDKVVPDISVGRVWSKYWEDNNLDTIYGNRIRYEHRYPDYFPQAKSNPQMAYAYPEEALGHFRKWLRENYIATKFPKYILSKVKDASITSGNAKRALEALAATKAIGS